MPRVAVPIINSQHGLHDGHKAIIAYAKQFGDVYVSLGENIRGRNHYLETGKGEHKKKEDTSKVEQDCAKLEINLIMPDYIQVSEERRISAYNRASTFINMCKDLLILEIYVKQAISAFATIFLLSPGLERQFDFIVHGPEPIAFFFKKIALLSGAYGQRPIYNQITKDKDRIKIGSTWMNVPFSKKRARKIIDDAKSQYKIGDNKNLVKEINESSLKNDDWKVSYITVYEGGFVQGRIEDTGFSYPTNPGTAIVNNIDYFE